MSADPSLPPPPGATPDCKHSAGRIAPVIDPNRCEGKSACVAECPYDVFVVRRRERSELPSLTSLGTLKWWMHGGLQAEALRADQCRGCGLCVIACPENAITLKRIGTGSTKS
jgi:NAD-dependent dihydropyrimidine dehydrogenase PreA subunit